MGCGACLKTTKIQIHKYDKVQSIKNICGGITDALKTLRTRQDVPSSSESE